MIIKPLPRSVPETQGVHSSSISAFLGELRQISSGVQELHSFMFLRNGHVVAEGWWDPYKPDLPHQLYSLSKSFTSTAVGMAVEEGLLTVEDPVISFFPQYVPAGASDNLKSMRVKHLLSMNTGHSDDVMGHLHADPEGVWVRGFLNAPVEHVPGTLFRYNTAATYILSAILHKLTGLSLLEYLEPRLFKPLGIANPTWESCPKGINTGGYGLDLRTEDIAKFGQLYLQKGIWQGERLISEAWVGEASSKHSENGPNGWVDWEQGYGYQFWMCRNGAYRGDGAFGQFCVVMPGQGAVVAITGAMADMQKVLDAVWTHLLPGMEDGGLPEDSVSFGALQEQLENLVSIPSAEARRNSEMEKQVSGVEYILEPNGRGLSTFGLTFDGSGCSLDLTVGGKGMRVAVGLNSWPPADPSVYGHSPTSFRGTWREDGRFELICRYVRMPYHDTITCTFGDDGSLGLEIVGNLAFGDVPRYSIMGKAVR